MNESSFVDSLARNGSDWYDSRHIWLLFLKKKLRCGEKPKSAPEDR
jgi:hypothetical protein